MVVIGSILLSSCDSYLDIQPVGQVIPTTLTEYRRFTDYCLRTKTHRQIRH